MSTTSINFLGLPDEAVNKLAELNIKSVEAFSSRVSDMESAESMSHYLGLDEAAMNDVLRRAFEIAPPVERHQQAVGGALIPDEDPEDVKKALAPHHEQWLVRGIVLADCLKDIDEGLHAHVSAEEGIDPLRYQFRHAPRLVGVSVAGIRCAVAITIFSHALEGLAFQNEDGPPMQIKLLGTGKVKVVDNQIVPAEYFVERIAQVTFSNKEIARKLFSATVVSLYKQVLDLPVFNSEVK